MNLKNSIPILNWLPSYKKEWLKGEKLPGLFQGEVQDALILNWINAAACPGL